MESAKQREVIIDVETIMDLNGVSYSPKGVSIAASFMAKMLTELVNSTEEEAARKLSELRKRCEV